MWNAEEISDVIRQARLDEDGNRVCGGSKPKPTFLPAAE